MQNVLLRLVGALRKVEPASLPEFFALAGTEVRRELLNQAGKRKKTRAVQASLPANADVDVSLAKAGTDELELWCRFHQEVEKLPALEREIMSLVIYHGWTQRRIAELLQISVRSVRRHLRSAVRKIQERLGETPSLPKKPR
jgi:RNA polymerase sigma factor (sigma-70 family)